MKQILATIAVLIALTGTCLGAINYFTPKSEHIELSQEFHSFRQQYRAESIQQRIWQLEGYYQCVGVQDCMSKMPPQIYNEYRALISELQSLLGTM